MADSLTDEQLVAELQSYGETIGLPIKPQKRPILVKKLNHLRSRNRPPQQKGKGKQPAQKRPPLNLQALSSEESQSENELGSTPGPSRSPIRSRQSKEPSPSSKITEVVTRSLRRRPNVSPLSVNVRARRESNELPARGGSLINLPRTRRGQDQASRQDYHEADLETSQNGSSYRSQHLYPNLSALKASPASTSSRDMSFSDRSTIPFESSDSDIDVDSSTYEVENKSVNTSFSLLRGRRSPVSNHVGANRQSPETNHSASRKTSTNSTIGKRRGRFYPEHVSFGLVALGLTFFVVIFFGYIVVKKELFMGWFFTDSSSQAQNYNYLLCSEQEKITEDCYRDEEVQKAAVVIKDLYTELSIRKGRVVCGDAEEGDQQLKAGSLLADLRQKKGFSESMVFLWFKQDTERLYNCCVDLIIANPSWNIRALTGGGKEARARHDVLYLESAVASMGLLCRLRRSFSRVLWSLFILAAGVAGLMLVLVLLWYRIQAKEREQQKVFAMVEQIIDLLKEQHEFVQNEDTTEQAGLPVQHVRDQLLPPARRKAMQKIWEQAVKFIEANESRVRLETQIIEGDEFEVWRWIQAVPNGGKVWQGQAFGEHNENNASTAIYSPTPCLKIRNMFDKEVESDENWEESVKDALLEKCRDIKSLVHIYVDHRSKEGCVYVKCNSKEAAGRVRQALHGWWFDGRLVTVKHIKVEHYYNRWPEARHATRPLQPSTNQMRSLAQPYHRSSLEMT